MRVDVKKILRDKTGRNIPGFIINYLRRIVHEDEVNFYLENFSHLPAMEFIRASLAHMQITYTARGMERLDAGGRYIFASNHPFGGIDGLMLADKVSERFGDARVVVNDLLMNLEPLKAIFIPVNKHGRQSPEYAKLYNDAFDSGMPIITFPAGLCSRRKKGVVADPEWKPSFVRQAIATKRDVVPVYFPGSLSGFFYRLSNLRAALGIKANIEMLYLADEMFAQKGKHFEMVVGEPISWQSLGDTRPAHKAAQIRGKVYEMGR